MVDCKLLDMYSMHQFAVACIDMSLVCASEPGHNLRLTCEESCQILDLRPKMGGAQPVPTSVLTTLLFHSD